MREALAAFFIHHLRSLYFALARLLKAFHYLNYGLALIRVFIGSKLLAEDFLRQRLHLELPGLVSLGAGAFAAVAQEVARTFSPRVHRLSARKLKVRATS